MSALFYGEVFNIPKRRSYTSVKEEFSSRGCTLLSKEYKNNKTPLDFICKCGRQHKITLNDLIGGHLCKWCGIKKQAESKILPYKFVKEFFESQGCELLSENYVNSRTKLRYRCVCGEISFINWDNFSKGQRCYSCGVKAISGENNYRWDHSKSDEDRVHRSYIEGYNMWRNSVYKRDNFTCKCCGDNKGGNLNAHHIKNFSDHIDLRIEVSNGITLCEDCHTSFHKKYGYKNNDEIQLSEFITNEN